MLVRESAQYLREFIKQKSRSLDNERDLKLLKVLLKRTGFNFCNPQGIYHTLILNWHCCQAD